MKCYTLEIILCIAVIKQLGSADEFVYFINVQFVSNYLFLLFLSRLYQQQLHEGILLAFCMKLIKLNLTLLTLMFAFWVALINILYVTLRWVWTWKTWHFNQHARITYLVSPKLLRVIKCEVRDPIGKSHHNVIFIWKSYTKKNIDRYRMIEGNLGNFYEAFNEISWHSFYTRSSIQDKVSLLYTNISFCIQCIPQSSVRMSDSDNEWINPLYKQLINQRWRVY